MTEETGAAAGKPAAAEGMLADRALTNHQKDLISGVKRCGQDFITCLHFIGGTELTNPRMASEELSTAKRKIREAMMWAVAHISK